MTDAAQTQAILTEQHQAFEAEARAVPEAARVTPQVGMADYIKESRSIAAFARSVWEAGPEGAPALKVARSKLNLSHLSRLEGLLDALQYVDAQATATSAPLPDIGPKAKRARFLISELDAALSFLLDDDIDERADDTLDALQASTQGARHSGATIGQLLLAWALFAQDERARLSTLDDFDLALIDEAAALGCALTSAKPTDPALLTALRDLRAGLATLTHRELRRLRDAADYVYRRHPDLRRKFYSALERNKRTRRRLQKKLTEVQNQPTTQTPPTT